MKFIQYIDKGYSNISIFIYYLNEQNDNLYKEIVSHTIESSFLFKSHLY